MQPYVVQALLSQPVSLYLENNETPSPLHSRISRYSVLWITITFLQPSSDKARYLSTQAMSSFTTDIEESLTDLKIKGYTEWATHLSKDDDYQIFRRFNALHLRAILHYQDRLRELEDKLYNQNKIAVDLSRRDDRNKERGALVEEITLTLNLYGMNKLQKLCSIR